jgi:hypothetical protein
MQYTIVFDVAYDIIYDEHKPIYSRCLSAAAKQRRSRYQLPCAWTQKHGPHLFRILHRDLSRERPSIAPHPDADLEKAATCFAVRPGICSCTMWNFLPQCVRNCVLIVPHHVARKQLDTAKNVFHRADIESWKLRGCLLE